VNYRKVNDVIRDHFPPLRIDYTLDTLTRAKWFLANLVLLRAATGKKPFIVMTERRQHFPLAVVFGNSDLCT
jgi:hypothetical protein